MSIKNQTTETLKKESVETLLRDAFVLNHEEETICDIIVENLDKINDDNVDEIAEALNNYVYEDDRKAERVLKKYNINVDPYGDDEEDDN